MITNYEYKCYLTNGKQAWLPQGKKTGSIFTSSYTAMRRKHKLNDQAASTQLHI